MIDVGKLQALSEGAQYTNNTPLLEATFYGKNAELLKAEKLLDEMVVLGHAGKSGTEAFADKMMQLANLIAKIFGFSSVQINNSIMYAICPQFMLVPGQSAGCTLSHCSIIKYSKYAANGANGGNTEYIQFDKNHRGIRFKKDAKYAMRVFLGMELFEEHGMHSLTGAEILAILLHEIGHNFYVGPIQELSSELIGMLGPADLISGITGWIQYIILTDGTELIDTMIPDSARKQLTVITNAINTILRPFFAGQKIGNVILNIISLPIIMAHAATIIFSNLSKITRSFIKYDSEKYSDAFATSYGYGTELSTALEKISHLTLPNVANPSIGLVLDFLVAIYKIPLSFILALLDEHPENNARLVNDIKYMEAAGEKITDPKLKKEYVATMTKMNKLREDTKAYTGSNPLKLNSKIVSFIQDLTHISDFKDLFSGLRPKLTKYANLDYTT